MSSYRTNVYQPFDEISDSRTSVITVNSLFPIPEFNGNDPQAWLSRASLYFKENHMVGEWDTFEKVKYVHYFMSGPAEIWFVETFTTQPKEIWECFCEKMLHHFTNPSEKNKNAPCQVSRPSITYFGHETKSTSWKKLGSSTSISGTQSFCKSHASGLVSSKRLVVKAMSALNIFESSVRRGKFDESRVLPDGSLMEITKAYSLDAGYDSMEDVLGVNWKNLIGGIVSIVTGRNKDNFGLRSLPQSPSTDVSFLGSAKNGETFLHPSVCIPSAPPLLDQNAFNYHAYKEVLEAEPPEWLPDSSAVDCRQCNAPFTIFTRGRHHCRFCGGIFCRRCSKGRCLLPVKFRERNPQRVCDTCYDRLDPLQGVLINTVSNAVQAAKHDVMDWTCSRGCLNLPMGFSMEHEIYKSANTLRSFCQVTRLNPEKTISAAVRKGAKGLAILTVVKAGVLVSYKLGTSLVVARGSDGSCSAPSAIGSVGLGRGAQVGGELMDFIIVLHDSKAVKTFCSRMHFSFGAGCSATAGPIGRVVEADRRAGDKGSGMCYTYNYSKGAFVGISLEGNVYKAVIDDGKQTVAIKRLNIYSMQRSHEFSTMTETLSELRHINLIPRIGYCNKRYEYMTGGSIFRRCEMKTKKNVAGTNSREVASPGVSTRQQKKVGEKVKIQANKVTELITSSARLKKYSVAGNRTRVSWVKARYPNRWTTTDTYNRLPNSLYITVNKAKM